jgi:two-component system phosphate regulon response regulator PhoB
MKIKIAMIDDDQHLTNLLSEVLQAEDFEVYVTNDSSEYFKLITDAEPDVVLLDWMMPGKNGIEILTDLKKNDKTKNIPVIMLTTKNMLNEVNRLFTAGADDYICKPFNIATIAGQIRDKLGKYQQRRNNKT